MSEQATKCVGLSVPHGVLTGAIAIVQSDPRYDIHHQLCHYLKPFSPMATPAPLSIPCFKTIAGLQTYLHQWEGKRIGLVPTMGALHQGHGSLIERAAQESDCVVVSIFVNPLQFGPQEDLHRYPRNLEQDSQLAQTWGASVIFAPEPGEMGVEDSSPRTLVVPPKELSDRLCGKYRPGHFTGVATIVLKLLNIVRPTVAYFGEKDAQQLGIIRRLVADLNIPVTIQSCPTVRETSGLALSSRNQYLSNEEKSQASQLYPALLAAQTQFQQGDHHAPSLLATVNKHLIQIPDLKLQYLALVDPQTLQPLETVTQSGLLALAAYVGQTRLIDNCLLRHRSPIIAIDGPAGAGKSTVTRQVADRLGLLYLDTGAMYRAIAWLVQRAGLDPQDEPQIAELVSQAQLELIARPAPQLTGVTLNGRDISEAIRTPEITALVSAIAAQKAVREVLVRTQRCLGEKGGLVAEGRDIGTQVFPDAEVKIFLTASVEERARRRLQDFQAQGQTQFSLEALQQEIARRDEMDSNREISPLRQAEDAIVLITDGLTIEAVITQILAIVQEKTEKTPLF